MSESAVVPEQPYQPLAGACDEVFGPEGQPRPEFDAMMAPLFARPPAEVARAQAAGERSLLNQGVTFSVYADERGSEKIFPFCHIPRPVSGAAWAKLEKGLVQRVRALEMFLADVYGPQRILEEKKVPRELVLGSQHYLEVLAGHDAPGGVRIHVAGIDLIRDGDGTWCVLEDNLRTPSGVSYVLENRVVSKRVLPEAFERARIRRVDHYPARLAETLFATAPTGQASPRAVVLTPGPYNSAYFEHTFLARQMGLDLVQPQDLVVADDMVFIRTTRGPIRVHTIYRRIDEAFLDPEVFRKDSMLGVPGLMRAWRAGKVTLANAPGNGVADDKAIYAWVPDIIRFYLSEEPLLAQIPTYVCEKEDDKAYVVEHLSELVVKCVDEAGGYGMLMGPTSTKKEREEFKKKILATPRRYVAQKRIELSTCPTWDPAAQKIVPRRVDLRPYILNGPDGPWVLPGGLTRVALVEGSYVVNSSQGGGSKDTWVQKEVAP